jgi:hypothetical protein
MGLKEKQAIANLDLTIIEKEITKSTGTGIKTLLDSSSFSKDLTAVENTYHRYLPIIVNGIDLLCQNNLIKRAFVQRRIKVIMLVNHSSAHNFTVQFKRRRMVITCCFSLSQNCLTAVEVKRQIEFQLSNVNPGGIEQM